MTQQNPPADPSNLNSGSGSNIPPDGTPVPAGGAGAPKKKKRHILLKLAVAVVVLLILLILLLPTIIGTGMVRDIVLNQVNSNINGKVAIKDWSFGWTSGVHIEGIEVTDANNSHVASVGEITCPISFLKAAGGNIDLGDTTITDVDVNATRDSKGVINLAGLVKPSQTPPSKEPTKLPNVKGTVHLKDVKAVVTDAITGVALRVQPMNGTFTITDINAPITDSVDLVMQLQNGNLGTIKVNGTLSAIQKNLVDIDHLAANQTLELADVDLVPVSKVLAQQGLKLEITGKVNGKITATVDTMDKISADENIKVADLSAGGALLQGDKVAYQNVQVDLKASRVASGNDATLKLDLPIKATPTAGATDDSVNVQANVSQDAIMQTADVFKAIAGHFAQGEGTATTQQSIAAGNGSINLSANVGVANLVGQLPHLMHLEQGTSLTSGRLTDTSTVTIDGGSAVIKSETHLTDFAGTNSGTPVKLANIDATAGLTAVGGSQPDLKQINVGLSSGFLNVTGGGESIRKTSFKGSSDLKNLQQQVGQFIDIDALLHAPAGKHATLAGNMTFDAGTDGDLTASDSKIKFNANLDVKDLNVAIPGRRTIQDPNLTASIAGNIHHTSAEFVQAINALAISVQSPAIQYQSTADVKLGGKYGATIPAFEITQGTINLQLLQEEFGGGLSMFIPPPAAGAQPNLLQRVADNSIRIAAGTVTISGKGQFNQAGFGFQQPLAITLQPTDVTLTDDLGTVQTVHLPTMALTVAGSGTVSDQSIATLNNLTVKTTIGTADAESFSSTISADAKVALASADSSTPTAKLENGSNISISRVDLTQNADLPKLQSSFGPLLPYVMPPAPAGTVPATQPSVMDLVKQNLLVCTSGTETTTMSGTFDGTTLNLTKPLMLSIDNLSLQQKGAAAGGKSLVNKNISTSVGGTVSLADGKIHASLRTLSLKLGDELEVEGDPNAPIDVSRGSLGAIAANGTVHLVRADLHQILQSATPFVTPDLAASLAQLKSGVASGEIKLDNSNGTINASSNLKVAQLTVGDKINNESITLVASASIPSDLSAMHDATLNLDSSFAKVSVTKGQLILARKQGDNLVPVGVLDEVQSVDASIEQADLAKLYALMSLVQPAAPAAGGAVPAADKTIVVTPAFQITGGMASLKASIARQGQTLTANVSNVLVHGLAVKSANQTYAWPKDITAELSASVDTIEDPTGLMPIMDQVQRVSVSKLSADVGITQISLNQQKPIAITGLSDLNKMTVDGGVIVDGDIEPAARLAEVFTSAAANAYPYKGHYHLEAGVAKNGDKFHPSIVGDVTNFQVLGTPAAAPPAAGAQPAADVQTPALPTGVIFSEDAIAVRSAFDFDPKTMSIFIDPKNPISIVLKSTGALAVSVTGTAHDLLKTRQIADDDRITIQLNYDLAKLWTIVKPLMPPSQQANVADLTLLGKQQRTITIWGSYPADVPFNQAIASTNVAGYMTIDGLSTHGIAISNWDVPFVISKGILRTVYPDKPEGSNAPKPAACNDGTLDIGLLNVDLRSDPMLATMEGVDADHPHAVLKNLSINPAMSKTLMVNFLNNPAFANANTSRGLLSLSVYQCKSVPLSDLVMQQSPANKGLTEVKYSIKELQIGSPLFAAFGNSSVSAEINDADVKIAAGRVTQDTTIMVDKKNPLRMAGVVVLSNKQFDPMTVYIPASLMGHLVDAKTMQYLPTEITVPMKGDMTNPKIDLGAVIAEAAKSAAKNALINGLLGGGKQQQNQGQQNQNQNPNQNPNQQQQQDPLGNLLNGLGKKKKNQ